VGWLKIDEETPDKPEMWVMAELLTIDVDAVFGKAFRVWRWFDKHTEEGNAPGVTFLLFDRLVGLTGFAAAMEKVGWLIKTEDGICLPNFDRHNGQTAKNRANTAVRVAKHKAANGNGNGKVTLEALPTALPREEKSKSKKNPPIPPKGGVEPEETGEGKPARRGAIALQTFLDACRAKGEKPILKDDPVFEYADKTGIPDEFLKLHWLEFKERYTMPDAKRYKDWRAVYRKSVRGCWFRLWFLRADGTCGLTTQGEQAKRHHGMDDAA
jgi:hypothetical protein